MMEDELIKIWQSSPEVERIKFEKSRLMLDMDSSLKRFYRLGKYGALQEQVAALIVIVVFLYAIIYRNLPILAQIASFLIIFWSVWYLVKLRKWKKDKPNETMANYLDYLKKHKSYLVNQKKWVDTSLYWYILPPLSGYFLFVSGFYINGMINNIFLMKLIMLGVIVGIGSYIWIRFISKKFYGPRLQKIDELIKVMEE